MNKIKTAVIIAGGRGTRFNEETEYVPKPMITIGGIPILQHIINHYVSYGVKKILVCGGYKVDIIKRYFYDQINLSGDILFDFQNKKIKRIKKINQNIEILVLDTKIYSQTAGRLRFIDKSINEENFFFTYGDGVSNINLSKLAKVHFKQKTIATLSAVKPPARYGALDIDKNFVNGFNEKKTKDEKFINGGFCVFNKKILKYIQNRKSILEKDVLPVLAKKNQLSYFKHNGFWQSMDNQRDKILLEEIWNKKHKWS